MEHSTHTLLHDLCREAEAARAAGDMPVAAFGYQEAIKLLPASGAEELAYELRLARAECLHSAGDYRAELAEVELLAELADALGDKARRLSVEVRRAALFVLGGDAERGRQLAERILAQARAIGARQVEAESLLTLIDTAYSLSDYNLGAEHARNALAVCRELGYQRGEARAMRLLGLVTANTGRTGEAMHYLNASLELCRQIGDRAAEAQALNAIGIATSDLALARSVYRQGLVIVEALGDREIEITLANNLGIVYAGLGLYNQARAYATRAVRLARAIGALELIATTLETLGRALLGLEQSGPARAALHEGYTLASSAGNRFTAAVCLVGTARVDLAEGRLSAAARLLDIAADTFQALGALGERATALALRAAVHHLSGEHGPALAISGEAVALLSAGHASTEFLAAEVWWWHWVVLTVAGDAAERAATLEQARKALLQGIATLSDCGLRRSYLGRVAVNRGIVTALAQQGGPSLELSADGQASLQDQLTRMLAVTARMNELHDARALGEMFLDEVVELTGAERIVLQTGTGGEPEVLLGRGLTPVAQAQLRASVQPLLAEASRRRRALLRELPIEQDDDQVLGARTAIVVPLISGARLVGVLYADVRAIFGPFTSGDLELVSLLAAQAATAMENARLYGQTLRAKAELEQQVAARTADLRAANEALARRAAEAQAARAAAEAASAAKSIFLANVSHELRTPLNAVIGFAQLLGRDAGLAPNHRELAQIIGRSGEHLLGLINDVLELSRIEAGRLQINPAPFDLRQLLRDVGELFGLKAAARQLTIEIRIDPNVPRYVVGDEGRLRQVLLNLIGNAVKFTHTGGVVVRAGAEPVAGSIRLAIAVEDTGEGITPADMALLFQPFSQTSTGRSAREGSGLGLALSRQIARLMGGDINVVSQPGVGSVFTCEVLVDLAAEPGPPNPMPAAISLVTSGRRYRVLVADDQWERRRLQAAWLTEAGLDVREASESTQAMAIWADWRPHVVVLDGHLPPAGGFEMARQIKDHPAGRATVVLLVAHNQSGNAHPPLHGAGYDDLLDAPVYPGELIARIARHLGLDLRPAAREHPAPPPLHPGDLAVLPAPLTAQLARAAAESDPELVAAALERVRQGWPELAARLAALAADFQYETIELLATHS